MKRYFFILFKIYDFRPFVKKPVTLTVKAGSITSSKVYNNLKLGKAIAIRTKAGEIVQINSKIVNFYYDRLKKSLL